MTGGGPTDVRVEMNIPSGYKKPLIQPKEEPIASIELPKEILDVVDKISPSEKSGVGISNEEIKHNLSVIERLRMKMKKENKVKSYDETVHGKGIQDIHDKIGHKVPSSLNFDQRESLSRLTDDKDVSNMDLSDHQTEVMYDSNQRGKSQVSSAWNLPFMYDYNTRNMSFIQTAKDLRDLGVKNFSYCLILYDRKLQGVDPHSPLLDRYTKIRVARECIRNPMYFIREVVRITQEGGEKVMFQLNRANLAALYLHFNNIDLYLTIPRQTGKTISVISALLWDFQFGTTNSLILFFNKDLAQSGENLARLKVQRDNLPPYLRQTVAITETGKVDRANHNVKSLKNPANQNRVITKPSAMSVAAAEKAGRGDTSPIHYYDEVEFTSHIRTIVQAAGPAFNTASESAAKNGVAYGRIFTSTPGDLDSPEGAESFKILSNTCTWSETFYDMPIQDLKAHIASVSKNQIVYIEYSYLQLGKSDAWLNKLCSLLENDEVKIEREIHLKRMHGAKNSAFDPKAIKQLMTMMKNPIKEDLYRSYYKIDIYAEIDRTKVYVAGMDCSEGGGRDYNAITLVDPTTYKPVLEFKANDISATELVRICQYIARTYAPQTVWAVERNHGGYAVMDIMRETELAHRIYFEQVNDVLAERATDKLDRKGFIQHEMALRKNSGVWTNQKSRGAMMNILKTHMKDFKDRFTTQNISRDIAALILKTNGRIDHRPDGHDDSVMSYLIALFVIYHGGNKERFGIFQGIDHILSEEALAEQRNESYEQMIKHEVSDEIRTAVQSLRTSDDEERQFQEKLRRAREQLDIMDRQDPKLTQRSKTITYESELGLGAQTMDMGFFDELNNIGGGNDDDPFGGGGFGGW